MAKAEGSGSAVGRAAVVAALIGFLMMSQLKATEAEVYDVGGAGGWTFNVEDWPNGKSFLVDDILKFNYSPSSHNVVVVDKGGYDNCQTPAGAKVFSSGNDQINLPKGPSYFICNFPGHCESGMKIAVNAA